MKNLIKIFTLAIITSLVIWSCKKTDNVSEIPINDFVGGGLIEKQPTPPTAAEMRKTTRTSTVAQSTGDNAVSTDVTVPTINWVTPLPGDVVIAGSTVTITVTAADNVGGSGLKYVECTIYNDGYIYKLPNKTTAPYTFTWNAPNFQWNPYTCPLLRAWDNAGNQATISTFWTRTQSLTQTPLPSGFPTSTILMTPAVLDQGKEASTTSIATAYNAYSIEKYYRLGSTSWATNRNMYSPEFVYNAVHVGGATNCNGGSALTNNLEFLKNNGSCFYASMPYSSTNACAGTTTNAQVNEASRNKILDYSHVYSFDINLMKIRINEKHPMVVVVQMQNTAYNSGPGFIWRQDDGTNLGGTAITIVGFDNAKQAYKCMTTWGPNKCDQGFLWVDYNFMTQKALQCNYLIL